MAEPIQSILITGAGRGLGAGLARHLSRPDRRLILHYHSSREAVASLKSELEPHCHSVHLVQADLTSFGEAHTIAQTVASITPSLDALINNAGLYHEKELRELTEDQWHQGLNTTATATFNTIRACLDLLKTAHPGHIVNIGDSSCDRPTARDLAISYHIGKTGVLILTKSFARELAPDQISVNMVSPGYLENSVGLPDPSTVPAGRFGTFEDIAASIEFLISRPDAMLTGSNLIVSGGWNLR